MLSFAILVHNEIKQIEYLLNILYTNKSQDDEIVILQDGKASEPIKNKIKSICDKYNVDVYISREFAGSFAKQKNKLNSLCSKDWIVNLDADEYIDAGFISKLKDLINSNPDIDSIKLPRINIIEGVSSEFLQVQKNMPGYGWFINEHNHINFPDYQERVYRNNGTIEWVGDVHEVISGAKIQSAIPPDYQYNEFFIRHPKRMSRQFLQNYKYLNIMEDERFRQSYPTVSLYDNYKELIFTFDVNSLKEDTIVLTRHNDDYDLESLNIKTDKRIIWITDNYQLYLYLLTVQKTNSNIEPYFMEITNTPNESEYYYNIKQVLNDDVVRMIYTINIDNKISLIRNMFELENNFVIL